MIRRLEQGFEPTTHWLQDEPLLHVLSPLLGHVFKTIYHFWKLDGIKRKSDFKMFNLFKFRLGKQKKLVNDVAAEFWKGINVSDLSLLRFHPIITCPQLPCEHVSHPGFHSQRFSCQISFSHTLFVMWTLLRFTAVQLFGCRFGINLQYMMLFGLELNGPDGGQLPQELENTGIF